MFCLFLQRIACFSTKSEYTRKRIAGAYLFEITEASHCLMKNLRFFRRRNVIYLKAVPPLHHGHIFSQILLSKQPEPATMASPTQIFREAASAFLSCWPGGCACHGFRGGIHRRSNESSRKAGFAQAVCSTVSQGILQAQTAAAGCVCASHGLSPALWHVAPQPC